MSFPLEDQRHLTAAQGYLELQMFSEANEELAEIDPGIWHLPEIVGVRIDIFGGLERWDLMRVDFMVLRDKERSINRSRKVDLAYGLGSAFR